MKNALSPEKRALLALRLQQKERQFQPAKQLPIPPLPRHDETDTFPLSFAQERLWFLDQMDNTIYIVVTASRLMGTLHHVALVHSLNAVIQRHEALRTTFPVIKGELVQRITPTLTIELPLTDLRHLSATAQEAAIQAQIELESKTVFELAQGPLIRAQLLQLADDSHIFICSLHHIICDGWSFDILIQELATFYNIARQSFSQSASQSVSNQQNADNLNADTLTSSFADSLTSYLAPLPIQYVDFAQWQRTWLQGEVWRELTDYWRQQFQNATTVLELTPDYVRPPRQTFLGRKHPIILSAAVSKSLQALSQAEGMTLFMTMLGAFGVLLYRYTQQADILIGTTNATRVRAEIEGLIGFFVNMLVLRLQVTTELTFRELLGQVREVTLGAYEHQDLPFEKLVEELNLPRDPSRNPLFQVMFTLHQPNLNWNFADLTLEPLELEDQAARFDLALEMWNYPDGLKGWLEYNTDLFEAATIARLVGHFEILLEAILAQPDKQITKYNMLSPAEKYQLLIEWNGMKRHYDPNQCVHQLFEAQVARTPEATAILFEGETITYHQLNEQSNHLAHGLQSMGFQAGQPIGIMLRDGPRQIIALLAVLKAGGIIVCLAVDYPDSRLKQILEEVAPAYLITESACMVDRSDLLEQIQATMWVMDEGVGSMEYEVRSMEHEVRSKEYGVRSMEHENPTPSPLLPTPSPLLPTANLETVLSPADPVYIVYTSGSTGRPKGIVQPHHSFGQFLDWFSSQYQIKPTKRVAQWASIGYDGSYLEIFATLCYGATLCMITKDVKVNPEAVLAWVKQEKISLLNVVPSFFRPMLPLLAEGLPDLEYLLLDGEVLPLDIARHFLTLFPHSPKLFNQYGPTECLLATYYAVETVTEKQRSIPVGQAIDGRQMLILDKQHQLCPIGVKGEIYIRTRFLTLGYFRRPELTQQLFIQNPLHQDYLDPVYKTGDVGRWLADGTIEFFGRQDHQVKLRGIRLELEEIEAVLAGYEAIEACAVMVHEEANDQRLVAYLVAVENLDLANLRVYLLEQLPLAIVPTDFIRLPSLPRTTSGKIDRKALPAWGGERLEIVKEYVEPRSPTEILIADIWQEVLKIQRPSLHDNFFDLGGHSLLATQVINKLRDRGAVNVPLHYFFESPTIADLAGYVAASQTTSQSEEQKINQLLAQVDQLSDEEVTKLLLNYELGITN